MIKEFAIFCFLLSLTLSHCSECTEKTKLDEDEDQDYCLHLWAEENEKSCFYNSETGGCIEKACKELTSIFNLILMMKYVLQNLGTMDVK